MTGYYTFKWRVYIIWRLKDKEGEMVGGGRGGGPGKESELWGKNLDAVCFWCPRNIFKV